MNSQSICGIIIFLQAIIEICIENKVMENKEIIKNLNSNNQNKIIETLKYISSNGNTEVLVHAINLLKSTKEAIIKDEIVKILENLKNQDCSEIIVKTINDPGFKTELSVIVPACWKNGLNYEKYIDVFVDIFIKSDFQLAFDAFTVIDNFEKVNIQDADKCIIKLNNAIEDVKEDKIQLLNELIKIINDLKENPAA